MVNSGSSANLLALASLKLKKNSEVITPSLTFSTTVTPIYQLGLVPNFIDVEINKFIVNVDKIEKNINKNTKALIIPNLLGNIPNYKKIMNIAKKYSLKVIEDSADTIGYSINGKNFGKFSDISTTSFYASHIVTGAGFGGMVCFNDKKLYEEAKILRGWGRSSATFNESEDIKKRFSAKVSGIQYDGKYIFLRMGYNFLPSEISAAFSITSSGVSSESASSATTVSSTVGASSATGASTTGVSTTGVSTTAVAESDRSCTAFSIFVSDTFIPPCALA